MYKDEIIKLGIFYTTFYTFLQKRSKFFFFEGALLKLSVFTAVTHTLK